MQSFAIETFDLPRIFKTKRSPSEPEGKTIALDGVTMQVLQGDLFGLLGPNGAGKTTLIKILATLLYPTSGRALVDGLDVVAQAQAVRERIAMVSGGETSLPPLLERVGGLLPMTYWLEGIRRGLFGGGIGSFPLLNNQDVFRRLVISTAVWMVLGYTGFWLGERRAKTTGNLDRLCGY